jgi:diguanylate cyclase (GGDEF)-like protein/PAS domain S-box-containing protein
MYLSAATMGEFVAMKPTGASRLKAQEEPFRLLFDCNPVPMWLHDPDSLKFLAVNDAAVAHYGYSEEAFMTMSLLDIVPQDQRDVVEKAIRDNPHVQEGTGQVWRHLKADGSKIDVLTSWRDIMFRDALAQLVVVMDVTEKRQAEKRISYMARHDGLTGLPNRLLFHEHLDEALLRLRRGNEKLAIHCLDLDHFKDVNDTLGHPTGDKLLMAGADRLRSCMRAGDIVARVGGDEFAILQMALKGPLEAHALAERIENRTSEPYDIEGHQIMSGASNGIALAPADGETSDPLLQKADMALYRAKEDGRCTFRFFEPSMDACLRARHALERDLRKAIRFGEFELFYQPLIMLETGVITGFEALLRWRSPERGMVSPGEFIPLAEETGLIVPLGEWVLGKACAEAATWPGDLTLAVNLSPVQFKKGNLPQVVRATLAGSGLPAARLELEITESILLEESKTNLGILRHLRALGVGISLDDFGTGYSSLNYLRSFAFNKIKIDRSFIAEVGNTECLAIVRAIAKLAADLGIPTVAEGVETEAQRELIRKEGCTEMQGYLFSRPVPAGAIVGLLNAHSRRSQAKECLLSA